MMAHPQDRLQADVLEACRVAAPLAARLREAKASITYRWLERITQRVTVDAEKIFPTQDLLDHVPLLIDAVADYLEDPGEEGTSGEAVIGKATELGGMRYEQGFSPYQILKEFEVLGAILLSFLTRSVRDLGVDAPPEEVLIAAQRVHQALSKIQQVTAARHLGLADRRANDREQRLRVFQRIVGGDVRTRIESALDQARALEAGSARDELVADLEILEAQLDQLATTARIDGDSRRQRNINLTGAAGEALRQVRDMAQERGVDLRLRQPLPDVEVNGSVVELCLLAYLTSAIRYSAGTGGERWVEVGGRVDRDADELVIEVRDNGRSVPPGTHTLRFEEFVRGVTTTGDAAKPGLGLGFVRETIESLGGRAWVERATDPDGSVFAFSLPSRRESDEMTNDSTD